MVKHCRDGPGDVFDRHSFIKKQGIPLKKNSDAKYVSDNAESSKDDKENSTNPELDVVQEIVIDFTVTNIPGSKKVLVL